MSFQTYRRDVNPLETDTLGRLFGVDVCINWPSNRNGQTKVLDSWKTTQLNLLRQKCVNSFSDKVNSAELPFMSQALWSNDNNNNNRIQRRYSRFFTISSQLRELSPTRTLKWHGRNRVQITCNTSSAYHVQVS